MSYVPVALMPRLPKIELPKFNGSIIKFYSFLKSFESSVDLNPSLPTIVKFNYFKASLEDSDAAAAEMHTDFFFGKTQQIMIVGHINDFIKILSCSNVQMIEQGTHAFWCMTRCMPMFED